MDTLIFATQLKIMANEVNENESKDFTKNWVTSSRFLFFLSVFALLIFVNAGCFKLYTQRYKGTPDVEVQSSSKFKPEYK